MKRTTVLSLLLVACIIMTTVGGTFAWFTDSETSERNVIQSGNLDVVLEYWNGDSYEEVTSTTKLFDDATLWEPGYTEVAYLKVSNAGSLALKYQFAINVYNEILGKTKTGADIKLSDYLEFKVVESDTDLADTFTRETARNANAAATKLQAYNSEAKHLLARDEAGANNYYDYVALIIYMPETVGNEANHDGVNVPSIEMGINLFATQYTYEEDSFDEKYDEDAYFPVFVAKVGDTEYETLADAFEAAKAGDTIDLLNNASTDIAVEVDKPVVLNLNGFNVSATEKDTVGDGVFHVLTGGDLTINGEGIINGVGNNDWNMAIWADGGKVTINGGYYTNVGATGGDESHYDLIYAKNGGEVVINGGMFVAETPVWTLNTHKTSPGTILVKGGTFVGFDPSANGADGGNTNYVADGYVAVQDGNNYVVTIVNQ